MVKDARVGHCGGAAWTRIARPGSRRLVLPAGSLGVTDAGAQAFDPGPGVSVPGSSVSGMRITGAPPLASRQRADQEAPTSSATPWKSAPMAAITTTAT